MALDNYRQRYGAAYVNMTPQITLFSKNSYRAAGYELRTPHKEIPLESLQLPQETMNIRHQSSLYLHRLGQHNVRDHRYLNQ